MTSIIEGAKLFFFSDNKKKKTSTAFKESFTEIKPNTIQSYSQPAAGPFTPYQSQASYYQSPNTPTTPQSSNNVPAANNYQSGSNAAQSNTANGYYGNNGYQQPTTGEQAGYQRSQGYKRPSRPNIPGYTKPRSPKLSTFVSSSPSYVTPSPKSSTQMPSYVPKSPSYTQGSSRAGIPAKAYQAGISTVTYPTTPESYGRVLQGNRGYLKSYTAKTPVTYNPQWSGSRPDQMGYTRTQTPGSFVNNRGPPNTPQYQNFGDYSGYPTRRYQEPSRYYYQDVNNVGGGMAQAGNGPTQTGRNVMQTGDMSQGPGYARNGIYSPSTTNSAFRTMPYQAAMINTASQGNRYSSVPQTTTNTQYNTAQYAGNIPAGQYQSTIPTSGQQSGQYGPLTNQYSTEIKSSVPQNPLWGNDVTKQMTSPDGVTITSYANDLQSPTQNAYPRNNVYANNLKNYGGNNGYNPTFYNSPDSAGTPVSQQYTSPYATQSITPEYGPRYAYSVGSDMGRNALRGNIPRPKSPGINQKSRTAHVTNKDKVQRLQDLRTIQGLIHGPSPNKNKPTKVNKLDANGQYPSDMKRYEKFAQMSAKKSTTHAQGAGTSSSTYLGAKQPANTRNGNRGSTRTQTPRAWNFGGVGSYDSWSAGMQAQKPGNLWNSGPVAKVDQAVKYNNDVTTPTSQPTDTNTKNKAATKNINIDNVVNNALTDFLTKHILRKRKRRKRENELT